MRRSTRRALLVGALLCCPLTAAQSQTRADSAWGQGDLVTARELYARQIAADSTDQRALHRLALMLAWDEQYDASLRLFAHLLGLRPFNIEAAVDRARVHAWRGELSVAIRQLDQLLSEFPSYLPALQARAQFTTWAGDWDAALATYSRIERITPGDADVARDRARVLAWSSEYRAARAVYDSLRASDPEDRTAALGLAQLFAWTGRLDSAGIIYQELLDRDPTDADGLRGWAQVATWGGDLVEAESRWHDALSAQPNDVAAMLGLGQTLRWQGRDAAALGVLRRAHDLDPTNREVLTELERLATVMRPRVTVAVLSDNDSDENRGVTFQMQAAWRPVPRVELRWDSYRRSADFSPTTLERRVVGTMLTGWVQFEPGWSASLTVGASDANITSRSSSATVRAGVGTPQRHRLSGSLSFERSPVEETAALLDGRVHVRLWAGSGRLVVAPGTNLYGGVSHAVFVGSEGNRRLAANVALTHRLLRWWTVGASARAFGFQKNLTDGYFDPDFYGLAELTARWSIEPAAWRLVLEVAPGLQQAGAGTTVGGTFRSEARVGYVIVPGREVSLAGGFSTTGLRVSAGETDYRYWSFGLSSSWRF